MLNPYEEYTDSKVKLQKWHQACKNNEFATDKNNNQIPLKNFNVNQVIFCGGCWRVQVDFPYSITRVRDKNMILMNKINYTENTFFEYWRAKSVCFNCYGPFVSKEDAYDYIVAKYETDNGTYWGYGDSIEKARAFLGIKLYDLYKELINSVACRNKMAKTKQ
ncbi:MAG: hypothetical protein MJ158_02905 [Alphaproteobacteria bacterium]|nr:hypothetical protein [Alphaproteobacteria bacterium]